MQLAVTTRSAAASDATKKLVVDRILRFMITDIITRRFPSVPRRIDTMLAMLKAITTDRGFPAALGAVVVFIAGVPLWSSMSQIMF